MEGIGTLIAFCFFITFGPPVLFLVVGVAQHNSNRNKAKVFYILSAVWLTVGGGICASIMM
jgi:hypothetical protein